MPPLLLRRWRVELTATFSCSLPQCTAGCDYSQGLFPRCPCNKITTQFGLGVTMTIPVSVKLLSGRRLAVRWLIGGVQRNMFFDLPSSLSTSELHGGKCKLFFTICVNFLFCFQTFPPIQSGPDGAWQKITRWGPNEFYWRSHNTTFCDLRAAPAKREQLPPPPPVQSVPVGAWHCCQKNSPMKVMGSIYKLTKQHSAVRLMLSQSCTACAGLKWIGEVWVCREPLIQNSVVDSALTPPPPPPPPRGPQQDTHVSHLVSLSNGHLWVSELD